ncbi:MAG: hypothetical protein OEX11_04920 [Nitrosomonas sp.]|nr:hypothetical protein [Nitrosomonas sp.]
MSENLDQITSYFETVPLWPFLLFGVLGIVAIFVEILNRKRRAYAIENFRHTIETELASMYPKHISWPKNINTYLCARLPEMQHNFEVLRVFLPQDRLRIYNIDWNNYCDFCRSITDEKCAAAEQSASDPSDSKDNTSKEKDPKVVFHKLVTNLLAHTNF